MKKVIKVNDDFQHNYSYMLSEAIGENFDPEFNPELSPKQMLELGVFGGYYFHGCIKEYPKEWFLKARLAKSEADTRLNYFEVSASQPLSVWQEKGWINEQDPRGWFQWYCRYYFGRRSNDDKRQINRWKAMRRHVGQIKKACATGDVTCRRRQRQALLHWAYDSRKI